MKTIYIGSDHRGFKLKTSLINYLQKKKIPFVDVGTNTPVPVDYPIIAKKLSQKVLKSNSKGILICGTGIGMSIAANKISGIRAAHVTDVKTAKLSRRDNDANVLALAGVLKPIAAQKIIAAWLKTQFSRAERYTRRIAELEI